MRRAVLAGAAVLVVAAGCTGGPSLPAGVPSTTGTQLLPAPTAPGPGACPATYADPDPNRPRITLGFDVSDDLGTVTGTERVVFRPDLPITEVVFRLTANGPTSVPGGTHIVVDSATARVVGGATAGAFAYEKAGAAPESKGGLVTLPLAAGTGQQVEVELHFTLTLGAETFERYGRGKDLAWFGSGQPLFAWERGVGWHKEDLAKWIGESATSEAADVDLTVRAPARYTVSTSGMQAAPVAAGTMRSWRAVGHTARDVSVAVGLFTTVHASIDSVPVTVAAQRADDAQAVLDETGRAVTELAKRFGPFPFTALNVTLLPVPGGGIEYPGSVLLLGSDRTTIVHEVAHQWFYGMVGDSQSRDPWLDEAFATYAEMLVDVGQQTPPDTPDGDVGKGINDYSGGDDYFSEVYGDGSQALMLAREQAGPDAFDNALRCYVKANAWRIVRPSDLADALHSLPAALAVLTAVKALP